MSDLRPGRHVIWRRRLATLRTRARVASLAIALLAIGAAARPAAQIPAAQTPAAQIPAAPIPVVFDVALHGAPVGHEDVTLTQTEDGWSIDATGREIEASLEITRFHLTYDATWQPRKLEMEGTAQGLPFSRTTAFTTSTATTDGVQAGKEIHVVQAVSPRTIVLPNDTFAGYEALAARLADVGPGDALPVYVPPLGELQATVDTITPKRVQTPAGLFEVREFGVTFKNPSGPVSVQVWTDERNRLARVGVPSAQVAAIRDDLSSVMARIQNHRNPTDEDVSIPADHFALAATITKPTDATAATAPAPAVVLVGDAGPADRDLTLQSVPIFGQLAGALADRGYFVVRYDKRGSGQSGGRTESAGLDDFADDAGTVVAWLSHRKDVDKSRIAVAGYAEGAAVALTMARKTSVAGLVLLAAPGTIGRDAVLAQQARALAATGESDRTKQEKIALEQQIVDAVLSGKGWDKLPASYREQADTIWFESWLEFDPAKVMRDVKAPLLILTGGLDTTYPPDNADRLEALGHARKLPTSETTKLVLPEVDHILVASGPAGGDGAVRSNTIAPAVTSAIAQWLDRTLAAKR